MATKKTSKKNNYTAEDIYVLEGLEPVRKRPGMYIGSTGQSGLHHLIWEVFDNGRDEAMGGFADTVEVALLPGNRVRVVDNGRGIPVGKHKQTKVSALETVMTTLHAGGKFGGESYKIAGGLHGVGVSVVNALSSFLRAEVHKKGDAIYIQEYERGKPKKAVRKNGKTDSNGTVVTFEPDSEIFESIDFEWNIIVAHLRQQAYLVKKLRVVIIDARNYEGDIDFDTTFFLHGRHLPVPSITFYFEGGLLSLVKFLNKNDEPSHDTIFYTEKVSNGIQVELAVQYVRDVIEREVGYANNIQTPEGGMHITGFRAALTRTLNDYAKKNNFIKDNDGTLTGEDVRDGITAVVSVKLREAQFEGQTKAKLGNPEARGAVDAVMSDAFADYLEENPSDAKAIIARVLLAQKARKAAKAAKDSVLRKGALDGLSLPGKLADCQTKNPEEAEIFIVEGDSAGGSSKQGRDRRTQAILPIRGKILNVERARIDKMLANIAVRPIIIALGTGIGEEFNIEDLRYHKVIIATDADVDGSHIRTLLLTLFFRYLRSVIEGGYLYATVPPLFKIERGKEFAYAFSDKERDKIIADMKKQGSGNINVQRYKGLGEMNPDQLWETTMDPSNRVLKQISIEDAEQADQIFDVLMGSNVEPRRLFIETNAREVENLDV